MIILNGTKSCRDQLLTKKKTLSPQSPPWPPHIHPNPWTVDGKLKLSVIWELSALPPPKCPGKKILATSKIPKTQRMDKLSWRLCEGLTWHVDWAWALNHPSLTTVNCTSGFRIGIFRHRPREQCWHLSGTPAYQLDSSWQWSRVF